MKKGSLNIALKLKGLESETGIIRLSNLLDELTALQEALQSIDKELNRGKSTLYYRVVSMSSVSQTRSGKVVIQPVLKRNMTGPRLGNRWGHLPEQIHHRFFNVIKSIAKDEAAIHDVAEPVIDAIAALLDGLGTGFSGGEIANKKLKFQLDERLKERVDRLLKPEYKSHGSFQGQLLAINVARGNRFYIYPEVGPRSVSCIFPDRLFEKAHGYIKKNVRVYGTKYFREVGYPFRIADVQSIELLTPEQPYPEFVPSQITVVGPAADELIRADREEADDL